MAKAVKVEVPDGMYNKIAKLVQKRLYRSFSDFFYVAGQKELDLAVNRLSLELNSSRHSGIESRVREEEKAGGEVVGR